MIYPVNRSGTPGCAIPTGLPHNHRPRLCCPHTCAHRTAGVGNRTARVLVSLRAGTGHRHGHGPSRSFGNPPIHGDGVPAAFHCVTRHPFVLRADAGASNKYRKPRENTLTSAEDSPMYDIGDANHGLPDPAEMLMFVCFHFA